MCLISVIIPVYNAEKTISETIASVLCQTFSNFEIIVINDGSQDRSLEMIQKIKDERLKVFSYKNDGVCVARNRGIAHAKGDFIAFLDADDLWMPDKLELQLKALQQYPEAGVAYSWTYFMYEEEAALTFHPCPQTLFAGNVYEKLLVSDFIRSASNVLIRSQAMKSVGEFDYRFPGCADWDYWLRLSANWHFVVVPKYQILYRQTPGAMSSNVEKMKEAAMLAMEKAYQAVPSELQYLKNKTLVSFHQYCADLYLQHQSKINALSQAKQHLWAAISLEPQILLSHTTQRTLIKFLMKKIFPSRIATYLLRLFSKTRTVPDPRLLL